MNTNKIIQIKFKNTYTLEYQFCEESTNNTDLIQIIFLLVYGDCNLFTDVLQKHRK